MTLLPLKTWGKVYIETSENTLRKNTVSHDGIIKFSTHTAVRT